ncbi:MAG: DUF1574 family protein [Myxococcales bacterium]|nr:DUF1574 family protein [Myxococcales bacterium]
MQRTKSIIAFAACLALFLGLAYQVRDVGEARFLEFGVYRDKLARIDEGRPAQALLLGESRTIGITGRAEQAKAHGLYNLAMPAVQGIFPTYYVLERYLAHNPAPKVVILGVDPVVYSGWRSILAGGTDGADPALDYHYRYASRVYALTDLLTEPEFRARPKALWQLVKAKLHLNKSYYDFLNGHDRMSYDPEVGTALFDKAHGWTWQPKDEESAAAPFRLHPDLRRHMVALIELARANGIKVVAYHPPQYTAMYEARARSGFYEGYWAYMDELEAAYPQTFVAWRRLDTLGHDAFIDGRHYSEVGSLEVADRSLAPLLAWIDEGAVASLLPGRGERPGVEVHLVGAGAVEGDDGGRVGHELDGGGHVEGAAGLAPAAGGQALGVDLVGDDAAHRAPIGGADLDRVVDRVVVQ